MQIEFDPVEGNIIKEKRIMKNLTLLFASALLLVFAWGTSAEAQVTVSIPDTAGNNGDLVKVKVYVELQPEVALGLAGMDIKLTIDPTVIKVAGTFLKDITGLLPSFGNNATVTNSDSTINLIGAQGSGLALGFEDLGLSGNPEAAWEIGFNVIGSPGDVSPITVNLVTSGVSTGSPRGTSDTALNPVDFAVNGSFSIPVDISLTTVVAVPTTLKADGADTAVITVTPRMADGNKISNTLGVSITTTAGSVGSVTAEADSTYTAVLTSSNVGEDAVVKATIVGTVAADSAVVTFAPFSDISVSDEGLDYGVVLVGTTADDTLNIDNAGNGSLVLGTLSFTGTDAAEFSISTPPNATIGAGGNSDAVIRFSPVSGGAKTATLVIPNNDPDAADDTVLVALTGVGGEPNIVTVDTVDFGDISTIGGPSSIDVEILSDGGLDLVISSVTVTGDAAFTADPFATPDTLDAQTGVDTVTVNFDPTAPGLVTASLNIFSDDPDTPVRAVVLLGTGIEPDIDVTPSPFAFGPVEVDSVKEDTLTIDNNGTDDLNISNISTTNSPVPFDAVLVGSSVIAPGASRQIVVQFQPDSVGTFLDTVVVESDDPDSPSFKVPLSGTGVVPDISISPLDTLTITDRIDTTGVTGKTTTGPIAVGNQGGVGSVLDVTYSLENITGGGTAVFSVDGASAPSPSRVPDGSSINIVIAFASIDSADTLQPRFARVIIASDDPNSVDTVIVQGIAVLGPSPKPRAVPPSLDFEGVFAGTTKDLPVIIGNGLGGATADPLADTTFVITETVISGDTLSDGSFVFSIVVPPPATINFGDSATVTVRYNAPDVLSPVANSGTLTLRDTVSNAVISIPLQGSTGNSIVTLSAATLAFPDHKVGRSGPPIKTLAIRNDAAATADAQVDSVTVSDAIPASADQFTFSPNTGYPRTIAGGGSLVLTVTFNPLEPTNPDSIFKDFAATMEVHNSDTDNATPAVDLTGTGLAPQPELIVDDLIVFTPTQLDTDRTFKSQLTLSIRNNALAGNPLEVLDVFDFVFTPGTNDDGTVFTFVNPLPTDTLEVLQQQTASFGVTFTPMVGAGALSPATITAADDSVSYEASLSIDSNDPTGGAPTITFEGQGFIRRGDVNFSGSVNVADASAIIDAILQNVTLPGAGSLALAVHNLRSVPNPANDPVNDATPDVLDVVRSVITIIGKTSLSKIVAEAPQIAEILIGDVQLADGKSRLPVMVENSDPILGAEIDLRFDPRALSLSDIRLTERSQDMTLAYNIVGDGEVKALLYSFDEGFIMPDGGAVLDVGFDIVNTHGDVSYDVEIENLVLSDPYGNSIPLDRSDLTAQIASPAPGEYSLSQNYPNPFNPETTIEFTLPVDGKIVLDVIDVSGQRVKRLMQGNRQAGSYTVLWNGLDERGMKVASGVYFYKIRAGDFVKMRKMVLIK